MTELSDKLQKLNLLLQDFSKTNSTEQSMLDGLTNFCVKNLEAAFARVWLIDQSGEVLILKSSSGQYTNLNGTRSRIKVGQGSKIDVMYTKCEPHISNDLLNDPAVIDKEWVKREGFVGFAGYPLCWNNTKLGVLGMYTRVELSDEILLILGNFSMMAAMLIYQTQQSEHEKDHFCRVAGIERRLLDQMLKLSED